jgi:hypothetical protein
MMTNWNEWIFNDIEWMNMNEIEWIRIEMNEYELKWMYTNWNEWILNMNEIE